MGKQVKLQIVNMNDYGSGIQLDKINSKPLHVVTIEEHMGL